MSRPIGRRATGFRQILYPIKGFPRYWNHYRAGSAAVCAGAGGEDAEDVASEAWLQIARDLRSFRGDGGGFRGSATTIARHRAMDHLRRVRRRPVVAGPVEDLPEWSGSEDTAESAVAAVGTDAALGLIARLPRDQAEAVLLRVVVGLEVKAAARVLGKRPGAVRTAAYRGLRKLADYLGHTG
ncbi:RNA polymerase sigma factor [Kibdelosporangium aridum]|uniref:RNA polymerase sigma factor n=1 Tax=Kibdelosporangium aridum TaxID=2030 RepID=UPI001C8C5776|nr:RNA polymerase sigma factor [Kibdelosporangium aridum]